MIIPQQLFAGKPYTTALLGCLFLLSACLPIYGQTTLNVGGKTWAIPEFNSDTLTVKDRCIKEDSLLIAHKFIKPLELSGGDFEARCYVKTADIADRFIMIILKGDKHKLFAELYNCSYVAILTDGTPGIKLGPYTSIWIQKSKRKVDLDQDISFNKLIESGLFTYPDKKLFDGGNTPGPANEQYSDFIVEVKLNGKYHSFRYAPALLKANHDNKKLIAGKTIINAFAVLGNFRRLI